MKRLIVILLALAGMQLHAQTPGSSGYNFTVKSVEYIKSELFMEEKPR